MENKSEDTFKNLTDGFLDSVSQFGKKMGSMMDDMFSGDGEGSDLSVRTDVYYTQDQYVIELEIPGVQKKETHIHIHEGILTVKGIKRIIDNSEEYKYVKRERKFGNFIRNFQLPVDVEMENIKAKYEAGVLRIQLPWAGGPQSDNSDIKID